VSPAIQCIRSSVSQSRALAFAAVLLVESGLAHGTGFFINQQSVRGLGRVNAGVVAAADDAATVFFNPAGLTQLWQNASLPADTNNLASVAVQLIRPRADFDNAGSVAATPGTLGAEVAYSGPNASNPSDLAPVPNIYYARRLPADGAYVGVGINSPFGLSTQFDSGWFGRYDVTEGSLKTINLGLVGGYRVNPVLSVGAGVDLQYADSKLVGRIPNPFLPGGPTAETDARTEVTGDAWTPGFNLGVLILPNQLTHIGLNYRSGFTHRLSGQAETTGFTGPLAAANSVVDTHADLKLPAIASAGISRNVGDKLTLFGQVDWIGWSTFEDIRVEYANGLPDAVRPENYRDTWSVSFGGDYARSERLVLRGGIRFDQTPTVDSARDTLVPDANRLWLGIGATYRRSDRLSFDLAFTHVWFEEAQVDVTRSFPIASSVRVKSEVHTYVDTLAAGVNYAY
jgi:long-chain fatty acid transport protein